jgi:cytidine deaminase
MTDVEAGALVGEARAAAPAAYSPYSKFRVGAAVACADGSVVRGCNVENASYGLAMCAERTALFAAVAAGHTPRRDVLALAVSCPDADPGDLATLMPCGACRQVIHELLGPEALVVVDGAGTYRVADLLPWAFAFTPPQA